VRLVIADTGPVNYLVMIGQVDLLSALFEKVILPSAVQAELSNRKAPPSVREWIAHPPAWLEILNDPPALYDPSNKGLDEGERAAIALATSLRADLLLMDDRDGVAAARSKGLRVTGTLGILDIAAERDLIDFAEAIKKLAVTSFRRPEALLASLLQKHKKKSDNR
jgi:predicted nucleic acid-binding protein